MNLSSLQTLTWGTVGAAIVSALALAAIEPEAQGLPRSMAAQPLPAEPTAAGPRPQAAASAAAESASRRPAPAVL
jgi:hypothetical protein